MFRTGWIPLVFVPLALQLVACASSSGTVLRETDSRRSPTIISGADGVTTQIDTQRELHAQSRLVSMSASTAYRRMLAAYDVAGLDPNMLSARDFIVGRQNLVVRRRLGDTRLSAYLNCGNSITGDNADSYEVTLTVITQVTPIDEGMARISTRVDASARPMGTSGNLVACSSTGRLERDLAERVSGDR